MTEFLNSACENFATPQSSYSIDHLTIQIIDVETLIDLLRWIKQGLLFKKTLHDSHSSSNESNFIH